MDIPRLDSDSDSLIDPLLSRAFGFELAEDEWMGRLRGFFTTSSLGRIGPYEVLATAGRGGQGLVYKARQPGTGREVAIKRLSAGIFSTPEMLARFEREIEAAAALDHPNIVSVYGSEPIDGQAVLVMQWVDGVPLDAWSDKPQPDSAASKERRGIRDVLGAIVLVCDAMQHAHQRGVIHRDMKPSNVLVDSDDRPHVLDFGLAKLHEDSAGGMALTQTGAFVGTPVYAAPEQLRGDVRSIDVRTDVYSLGAVFYRALTGRAIVDPAMPFAAMVQLKETLSPTPPSSINAECNREVDAIVLKAVHPDREQRYSSVEALCIDIQRYLAGEAVLAHPPSVVYRAGKFVRRHAVSSALAGIALAALLTLGIVSTLQAARERDLRRDAEQEAKLQRDTADFLLAVIRPIALNISNNRQTYSIRDLVGAFEKPFTDNKLSARPEVALELHRQLARMHLATRSIEDRVRHLQIALQLTNQLSGIDSRDSIGIHRDLADAFRRQGRIREAEQEARLGLAIIERTIGRDSIEMVSALIGLADVLSLQHRTMEGQKAAQDAVEICDRIGARANDRAMAKTYLGQLYVEEQRLLEALPLFDESLSILTEAGSRSRSAAKVRVLLGSAKYSLGEFVQAERLLADAAKERERRDGLRHYQTHVSIRWHGRALQALAKYNEAADQLAKALVYCEHEASAAERAGVTRFEQSASLLAAGRDDEGRRNLVRAVSRGKATALGTTEFDAQAARAESALRANGFRLDGDLLPLLGDDLRWLVSTDLLTAIQLPTIPDQ